MSRFTIECVVDCQNHLGEGPLWDQAQHCLYWVDSTGRRVGKPALWRYDPSSGDLRNWHLDHDVGAIALRENGGAVLALNDGLYVFDWDTNKLELITHITGDTQRGRLNDGKCDARGRFIVGGMDDQEELPICALWRLDPDLTLHKLEEDITCANAPCWSPDGRIFYFTDTFTDEIRAYDYDLETGSISNRRTFTSLAEDVGYADGGTVDAEGYVWNAQVIGGDLVRYAPDGSVDRRIGMPVKNITSVMFGGEDLEDIYVTSMARVKHVSQHDHFQVEARPQFCAGGLFRIRGLGIRGIAERKFAG